MNATEFKRFTDAQDEITRLRCDGIEHHQGRDVLDALYQATSHLPACGASGIMCSAAQEIDALRGIVAEWLSFKLCIYPGGGRQAAAIDRLITKSQQATQTKGDQHD